jgi:hypothetical protein
MLMTLQPAVRLKRLALLMLRVQAPLQLELQKQAWMAQLLQRE